jgi:TPP-dependent indolepyruvate ferredoxin oxidoreductase alpha subunit
MLPSPFHRFARTWYYSFLKQTRSILIVERGQRELEDQVAKKLVAYQGKGKAFLLSMDVKISAGTQVQLDFQHESQPGEQIDCSEEEALSRV